MAHSEPARSCGISGVVMDTIWVKLIKEVRIHEQAAAARPIPGRPQAIRESSPRPFSPVRRIRQKTEWPQQAFSIEGLVIPMTDHGPHQSYKGVKPADGKDDPELDPFEIEFLPEFRSNRGPREPFINDSGVVIGDHDYASPNSPLEQWSEDTDPAVMAGEQWVHPYKDIGFRTRENRDYFERGIPPQSGIFMHPTQQVSAREEPPREEEKKEQTARHRIDPDEEMVMDEP